MLAEWSLKAVLPGVVDEKGKPRGFAQEEGKWRAIEHPSPTHL